MEEEEGWGWKGTVRRDSKIRLERYEPSFPQLCILVHMNAYDENDIEFRGTFSYNWLFATNSNIPTFIFLQPHDVNL